MTMRTMGTFGLAGSMVMAVLVGAVGVIGVGPAPMAGATATIVPNPDPAIITEWKPCQPGAGVTEFVDFGPLGSGKVDVSCAPTIAAQTSGFEALTDAGFTHTTRPATPGFLTTITGCPGKTCPLEGTIGSGGTKGAYWSYWLAKAPGDPWGYSGVGGADPESSGTNDPFQAWAYGGTAPPVPVMDSTGPVAVTPDPEPTSAQALTLAESWTATAFGVMGTQCAADFTTCGTTPLSTAVESYVEALTAAGVPTDQIDPTVLDMLRSAAPDLVSQYTTTAFIVANGGITGQVGAAPYLSVLAALHTPADATLISTLVTRIQGTVQPDGLYPGEVRGGAPITAPTGTPRVEGPILAALLAAGSTVPATAVDGLATYQVPTLQTTTTKGTTVGLDQLTQQILGLAAAVKATPADVTGGTVTSAEVRSAIATDAARLAAAQKPDGGFDGGYANRLGSMKLETTYATGTAAQGLAVAGQTLATAGALAAARAASRWLASMQLTPAAVGIRAGSAALGLVTPTPQNFVGYATNGLGYNPATAKFSTFNGDTDGAADLEQWQLPDAASAMLDWSLAPYADATIGTSSATATTSAATVTVSVTAGTDPQAVSVDYGTTLTLTSASPAGSVAVAATATRTVTVTLTDLTPNTTYFYRVVTTSPVRPGSKDVVTVASTIQSFTTPFAVALGTTANLATAVGYLTSPANLVDGTAYEPFAPTVPTPTVGLTVDGAFALAATKTANPTLAMIATWVATNADSWTGLGTANVSGGALGKEALLAEVVGQDPHDFGGHDLIAALDQAVCTKASGTTCVAAGNYTTSSSVFDQALGILAQLRAGDTAGAASPVRYLESLQKPDGAWSGLIPASTTTTVDSTAMAVMALALTPSSPAKLAVQTGLDWLVTQQQGDGGFLGASGISTNSTALAVMALGLSTFYGTQIAAAQAFLAAEQNPDGGFTTAAGTTTGSNLRASTQAVNGVVGTSFGTLSDPLTGPTPPAPPAGTTTAAGGSSSAPTGTADASLPPATPAAPPVIAASGSGQGAVTVAKYASNPTAGAVSGGTGVYYDVALATGSSFSSVTVTVCTLGPGGQSLTWWNGSTWAPFSDQSDDAATGCVTATVTPTTSPTEAQLTGTPVAPSTEPVASITPPTTTGKAPAPSPAPLPATPTGQGTGSSAATSGGYLEVAADGEVFAFGDAQFEGSMGGKALNAPVVGIAATPTGHGYWEVAADGGVFAFGNAGFYGSMGGQHLDAPVVGIVPTATGQGYWEVASDGGIFAFGDARFEGSMGGKTLNAPVVGIAPAPTGKGYWEIASDGGVFAFGSAPFDGSMAGRPLDAPVVGIAPTLTGQGAGSSAATAGGYLEVASDGGIFAFGDARFEGSMGGKPLNAPIVGVAASVVP